MKITGPRTEKGFTLIELIGVMAIMAILASVVTPTAVRAIERAVVSTEKQNLERVGKLVREYTKARGAPPGAGSWTTDLALYTDMNAQQLQRNNRRNTRVFLLDPATNPSTRVIVLSNMREGGRTIPTTASAAQFQIIWDTAEGEVPATTGWTGWVRSFDAPDSPNSIENVVIERINLNAELRTCAVTLNNTGAKVSYATFRVDGTQDTTRSGTVGSSPAPAAPTLTVRPRIGERCVLYNTAGVPNYTYVAAGSDVSVQFDGTNWKIP